MLEQLLLGLPQVHRWLASTFSNFSDGLVESSENAGGVNQLLFYATSHIYHVEC